MGDTVIKIENLYKEYKLGVISHGTLYRDLQSWWAKARGKEDPNSLISSIHNEKAEKGSFLALKDISFEVKAGERIGIIGKNGAGKSTLLKVLSRITSPTRGEIKVKGRIGSLLEVGTGFHPELTGRENIYLNGSILGMRKGEINKKLDEIVDFAGIEKHLDTPVKRYSSGMNVRLGFAVAAHLDPEILVVDEVLAVGDAEFQKKAIGKMENVSKEEGRTVLFVSHNLASVRSLCNTCILLERGNISCYDNVNKVIDKYINTNTMNKNFVEFEFKPDKIVAFTKVWLTNKRSELSNEYDVLDPIIINFEFLANKDISDAEISIVVTNSSEVNVLFSSLSEINENKFFKLSKGKYQISVKIKENYLVPDIYQLKLRAHQPNVQCIDAEDKISFVINETGSKLSRYGENAKLLSCVLGGTKWKIERS